MHGKATRYTQPHRKVARAFSLPRRASYNFAELIHRELKAFAKKKKAANKLHMNCGPMLTRLAC
eukprot:c45511_g1_i1 orf=144-335(+)